MLRYPPGCATPWPSPNYPLTGPARHRSPIQKWLLGAAQRTDAFHLNVAELHAAPGVALG